MTEDILTGLLLAFIVSGIAWYRKWLNIYGAFAATLMGTVVWTVGSWQAALPLLLFFVSSSMLSLALGSAAIPTDKKDRQPRDAVQVICNGGIAVICLLFSYVLKKEVWAFAYWASIAVSTADTWSSAIGNRFAGRVIDIKNGKPMMKGLSGGISFEGSLGGFAGAGIIATAGFLINGSSFWGAGVLLTGFAGMMIDSLLGSWVQARYRLDDGKLVEFEPAEGGVLLEKGWAWMTNDVVNLLSNAIAITLSLLLFSLCA